MDDQRHMQAFWDERARENAMYFVDNNLDYARPDSELFWRQGEEAVARFLELFDIQLRPEDHVVEIGCGLGRLTRALAVRAARVTAIDVSAEMLQLASEANPQLDNVLWWKSDGTSLAGVDSGSADGCFSHVVFQHIPDPTITLGYVGEMGRVLRPRGWAAFQISNDPTVHRPREGLRSRLRVLLGRAPRGQRDPAWLGSAVDLGELRDAAERAGLSLERVVGAGTQFCLVLLRKREPSAP